MTARVALTARTGLQLDPIRALEHPSGPGVLLTIEARGQLLHPCALVPLAQIDDLVRALQLAAIAAREA